MPVILFNAQPLISFAYLKLLPAFISYVMFFFTLAFWLNICLKNGREHGYPFHGQSLIYIIPIVMIAYLGGYAWIFGMMTMLEMFFCFILTMFIFIIMIPYFRMLTYNRDKAKGFLKYAWGYLKEIETDMLARK